MKMYIWRSNAVKGYRQGHIIAIADCVENARVVATVEFRKLFSKGGNWDYRGDDDEDVSELTSIFLRDIASNPIEKDAIIIFGSD